MPVVEMVADAGMMDRGDASHGNRGDLHNEEEDVLESQQ